MSDKTEHPLTYVELPPEKFPVLLQAIHPDTGDVVWSTTVETPEDMTAVYIPPLKQQLGHPVAIRIAYGDGSAEQRMPPG